MSGRRPRHGRVRWLLLFLVVVAVAASCASLTPRYEGPVSDHFDGRVFHDDPPVHKSLGQVFRWQLSRRSEGPWTRDLTPVRYEPPPERVDGDALRVTFVNHATVLVQTAGLNIVTDPIWSQRASPLASAGPERHRAPGLAFQDLPPIDLVLVSHNHFDHMDAFSVRLLSEDHDPLFIAPLGNCYYLARFGARRCRELDWWEQAAPFAHLRIYAVPVRHWARRGILDTNRSLWAGFVIETDARRVFFAGDTGMGEHFEAIRRRLGSPDVALLPIGAYLPRWFMSAQHIDPAEAVAAHRILGAKQSMAIHFGTFRLADDGQEQPVADLLAALNAAGMPTSEFWIPDNGDSRSWPAGETP
jgi:L-ascorbate metabolism protein UlaG (beta-lactamase superfamily)